MGAATRGGSRGRASRGGPWRASLLGGMLALSACNGGGDYADGSEVLEAAGVCEGEIERTEATQDLWRCPSGETAESGGYVMADVSEDPEQLRAGLRLLLDLDGAGTMVLGEDWSIIGLDPEHASGVARATGGRVVHDEQDLDG